MLPTYVYSFSIKHAAQTGQMEEMPRAGTERRRSFRALLGCMAVLYLLMATNPQAVPTCPVFLWRLYMQA